MELVFLFARKTNIFLKVFLLVPYTLGTLKKNENFERIGMWPLFHSICPKPIKSICCNVRGVQAKKLCNFLCFFKSLNSPIYIGHKSK